MKLARVNIHAFRSIVDQSIRVTNNCMGIIGKNEAGKSNFLLACSMLSPLNRMGPMDSPKMTEENPEVSFDFKFEGMVEKSVKNRIKKYCEEQSPLLVPKFENDFGLRYSVKYDMIIHENVRSATLTGVSFESTSDIVFLDKKRIKEGYLIMNDGEDFVPIEQSVVLPQATIEREDDNILYHARKKNGKNGQLGNGRFNLSEFEKELKEEVGLIDDAIIDLEIAIRGKENEPAGRTKRLRDKKERQERLRARYLSRLENLYEPLSNSYTKNVQSFLDNCYDYLEIDLVDKFPSVVFWEATRDLILPGFIPYSDIFEAEHRSQINRPLLNLLLIGIGMPYLENLQDELRIIESNPRKRSKLESRINKNINKFLKSIWEDYQHELVISLEGNQARLELFDPSREDGADYFEMSERSDGGRTFLSFIFTISAEVKSKRLQNLLLLLDEPETHLHPSGVRQMLAQLKHISFGNNVFYATHSPYMLDRSDYSAYLVVEKTKDESKIQDTQVEKVGHFLAESAIFESFSLDIEGQVVDGGTYNFVFERDFDKILFENYYNALDEETLPYSVPECKFYNGGKCKDIIEHFKKRPIRLGTKWIFLIDGGESGRALEEYFKTSYSGYIDKDVFVFKYFGSEAGVADLLPSSIIGRAYKWAIDEDVSVEHIKHRIWDKSYREYSQDIERAFYVDRDGNLKDRFMHGLTRVLEEELKKGNLDFDEQFLEYFEFVSRMSMKLKIKNRPDVDWF